MRTKQIYICKFKEQYRRNQGNTNLNLMNYQRYQKLNNVGK